MIQRVEFRNFKALRDACVDLEPFTVLVGPNASGKTSVLQGMQLLLNAATQPVKRKDVWEDLCHGLVKSFGASSEISLLGFSETAWIRLARDPKGELPAPPSEPSRSNTIHGEAAGVPVAILAQVGAGEANGEGRFPNAAMLRLDIGRLIAPSYSQHPVPRMRADGDGFSSALAYLAANEPAEFERVIASLRQVIPIVRGVRFRRAEVNIPESEVVKIEDKTATIHRNRQFWGDSIEFDMVGAERVPADQVSEGTLLVLGLLTSLMEPKPPGVLLIDDIDRALHPKAQRDLIDLLRKLMEQRPELQIVATSHSPYLLDHLRPEEVRLTALAEDGSAVVGRLDGHPEFERWKEEMTPGEFWSMVGEDWLLSQRAREQAK